jgi:hypothetical protein
MSPVPKFENASSSAVEIISDEDETTDPGEDRLQSLREAQ